MNETFQFDQYLIEIDRKRFYNGIRLEIIGEFRLRITTPKLMPYGPIVSFLKERQDWLHKHHARLCRKNKTLSDLRSRIGFEAGQSIPILGNELTVEYLPSPHHQLFCSHSDEKFRFHYPMANVSPSDLTRSELAQVLVNYFQRESEKYLASKVNHWALATGLTPTKFKFRNQASRWGSCSAAGGLSLNRKLYCLSHQAIDYVIIHELCHLKHLNHSQQFWDLVHHHCEHVKSSERELKDSLLKLNYFFELLKEANG